MSLWCALLTVLLYVDDVKLSPLVREIAWSHNRVILGSVFIGNQYHLELGESEFFIGIEDGKYE